MTGYLVTYVGWCILLFIFTDLVFDLGLGTPLVFKLLVEATIGLFLNGMALKIVLGGNDVDTLPTKVVDLFTRMSAVLLFGLGILLSPFFKCVLSYDVCRFQRNNHNRTINITNLIRNIDSDLDDQ